RLKDLNFVKNKKFINKIGESDYKKRTIEIIHVTMSNAMSRAVTLELIPKNPCKGVVIPDKDLNKLKKEEKLDYLSKDDVAKFLTAASEDDWKYYILFKLLIDTGLRKGEALALQWNDLDLDEKRINIYKTFVYDQKEIDKMFSPPKTESSHRSIRIDKTLVNLLMKHQIKQKEKKLKLGEYFHSETNLIFERGDGLPFAKSTLQRAFNRICKKADIKKHITIHGLRHTHAVLMLESGASLKEIQERLGHKTIATTADIYAHISETVENRSVENYFKYMNEV
ncbi:tyrosine-type recombinase/integrase, partial [Bacillus sp. JJ722]|uniref:tyrosine-type recombinase/integrase n=1 Tax=Bacillus sp. JJ722 TaxID=3122973 RepID=UPI002FFE19F5